MANSYLSRTPGTATNNNKFTLSVWAKRSKLTGDYQAIFDSRICGGGSAGLGLFWGNDESVWYNSGTSSSAIQNTSTSAKFRDMNAWYHIVVAGDTTQSGTDKLKIWVNGVQQTSFGNDGRSSFVGLSYDLGNATYANEIGRKHDGTYYYNGYLSHIAFVDGTALTPTSFGETDSTSGIWKFKSPSGITWGNNGFHLKFENAANLGLDSSGNSNNFTKNGNLIQSKDTPSIGLCTLNPNLPIPSGFNITNGNLSFACSGSQWQGNVSSIAPTKGKWYYECQYTTGSGIKLDITRQKPNMINMATNNQSYGAYNDVGYGYQLNNSGIDYYCNNNTCTTWNSSANGNSTKIYMVCIDLDNGKYWIGANGTWANKTGTANPATGTDPLHSFSAAVNGQPFFITLSAEGTGSTHHANFGNGYYGTTAVSTNSGNGYSDANSEGKFSYQPPSGYYALTTKNYNTYG